MITKEELVKEYERVTDNILDECDWKTHFTSIEACTIVYNILRRHNIELPITLEEFHRLYMIKITTYWNSKFTHHDVIDNLYDLITISLDSTHLE
jgi:hypothetical protein